MLGFLLFVGLLNLGVNVYLLVKTLGQRPQPASAPPVPEPVIPSTYDTSTLLLCEPVHRAIRHEVSVHLKQPPTSYVYQGRTYRYRSKMSAQRYEYVEVR